jgi:hypothetical protein
MSSFDTNMLFVSCLADYQLVYQARRAKLVEMMGSDAGLPHPNAKRVTKRTKQGLVPNFACGG